MKRFTLKNVQIFALFNCRITISRVTRRFANSHIATRKCPYVCLFDHSKSFKSVFYDFFFSYELRTKTFFRGTFWKSIVPRTRCGFNEPRPHYELIRPRTSDRDIELAAICRYRQWIDKRSVSLEWKRFFPILYLFFFSSPSNRPINE